MRNTNMLTNPKFSNRNKNYRQSLCFIVIELDDTQIKFWLETIERNIVLLNDGLNRPYTINPDHPFVKYHFSFFFLYLTFILREMG